MNVRVCAAIVSAVVLGPAVVSARAQEPATPVPMQTPVAPNAWATGLLLDHKARQAGDFVTVQIIENISASGSADANLDKNSKTSGALPWPIPSGWSRALDTSNDTTFTGGGTTNRAATISATMGARVVSQQPNGDLNIVGVREIVINGDRQFVTLSGVVRPADIAKGNVVLSAMVGDLRIQYSGQGFMKDNLSPGWLVRILNKIF
jgi:flagellar L-ring protein precursor FlgH